MTNLAQTETTEPQAKTETVHPLRAAVEIAFAAEAREDETERLRAQVATLERDIARARRCIATLCRIAFPSDTR